MSERTPEDWMYIRVEEYEECQQIKAENARLREECKVWEIRFLALHWAVEEYLARPKRITADDLEDTREKLWREYMDTRPTPVIEDEAER